MMGRKPGVPQPLLPVHDRILRATWWLWLRFSARRVIRNPLRVVIVIFSVALATTLASAVLRVSVASISSFERSIAGGSQPYHALIAPIGGRLQQSDIAPCLQALASHADILAMRREAAVIVHDNRTIPIRLVGVGIFSSESLEHGYSKRVIAPALAAQIALEEVSSVDVQVGEQRTHFEVTPADASRDISGYADVVVALTDISGPTVVDSIALRFKDGRSSNVLESTKSWIASCLQGGPPIRVEVVQAPIERGEKLLGAYRFNVLIMAAITLVVCAILISQATQITLRSIARELAILRTLGVSARTCLLMVVSESSFISFIGATLGATLGAPLVVWMAGFLSNTASEIYSLSLEAPTLVATLVRSFAVIGAVTLLGAVAALLGARSVLRIGPYRGARREQRVLHPLKVRTSLFLAVSATCLMGIAVWLLVVRPAAPLAYATVGIIVLWAAAIVPILLQSGSIAVVLFRFFLPARLAGSTLCTSGKSFVLSGMAASVAISLLVGLALMVGSFRETLKQWSAIRLAGDIFISSAVSGSGNEGRLQPQVMSQVTELSHVKRVIPYYETTTSVGSQQIVVGGVDLAAQCSRKIYTFVSGGCIESGNQWSGSALASEAAARKLGLKLGDTISIAGDRYSVQGIIQEFGTEQPLVVLDSGDFQRRYRGHYPETLTIDLFDSRKVHEVQAQIRTLVSSATEIRNQRELLSLVETLFNRTFRITDSVRWIVFVLALLGLVSTTAQHIWERRQELRVAEVLGVSRLALVAALIIEAVMITIAAVVAGLAAGFGIGWCLTEYINPLVFGWSLSFRISWSPFVEGVFFAACVGVVTWGVSTRMISRIVRTVGLEDE